MTGKDSMSGRFAAAAAVVLMLLQGPAGGAASVLMMGPQPTDAKIVLAVGESFGVPETSLVITFEAVEEDSRCPVGTRCLWEGDAAIRIRLGGPDIRTAAYTLHTNERFERTITHGQLRVALAALAPYPAAGEKVKPDQYRVTLEVHKG
jgi:hypothetical protein